MKNKVILIFPKTGVDPEVPHVPHSIMILANPLLEAGYQPILVDPRVEPHYKEKIKIHLSEALCVGITSMTGYQIKHGLDDAKFIKNLHPEIPIVWGGVHPTALPEQTVKNPYVDIVVKGEGEETLLALCKNLKEKKCFQDIPSITYQTKKGIKSNSEADFVDINKIKKEPWHLVDTKKYIREEMDADKVLTLVTSRGCPYQCAFCYNRQFNKSKWRGRKAEYVLAEIEYLVKEYGINGIDFIEDSFFIDKKRVEDICHGLIKKNFNLSIRAACRASEFSRYEDEFINLLKKAGIKFIQCGIESGSQRILNFIKKGITIEQVLTTTRKLKEHNIEAGFTFMSGFPTETKKDLYQTLDLIDHIREINPDVNISSIFTYTAYPGTELYHSALQHGFKEPQKLEEWGNYTFFTSSKKLNWLSKKNRRFLQNLSFIARFAFYQKRVERSFKNPIIKIIYKILRKDALIRWKHRYFKFSPEWWFISHTFQLMANYNFLDRILKKPKK